MIPVRAGTALRETATSAGSMVTAMATWKDRANLNLPFRTLGGRQFWGDVAFEAGWRIQQHVVLGHYRLLDPQDVRWMWGSRAACEEELRRRVPRSSNKSTHGRTAVFLVHGITRSSKSFARMQRELTAAGYLVVPFDYPSTRVTITQSGDYLRQVVESLRDVDQIDFVTHSLGGLVVRAYLQLTADRPDPRCYRMVMLGVPNQGARLANVLRGQPLFRWVYGPAGQQLVDGVSCPAANLPVPKFEFAIVAGARGDPRGFNPLIPGDDDGVVSVDATRLPGAADFMTVHCLHTLMNSNDEVVAATLRFLATGVLRSDGRRQPIPPVTRAAAANDAAAPAG